MTGTTRVARGWMFFAIGAILASWLTFPLRLNAQVCSGSQGNNGVWNPTCFQQGPGVIGSSAFIDASMFAQSGSNLCKVLNGILSGTSTTYPATGAVVDARGLANSTPPTSMTCTTTNPSPWAGITNPPPSTILLPATGGATPTPIIIPSTWVLPNNTRLIGEGDGIPSTSTGFTPGTMIQAVANGFTGSSMIQFGTSASVCGAACSAISVEQMTLDGQAQAVHGIVNQFSQPNTYVDHVTLYQILGTGLLISGSGATDSGPYTNITFDTGIYAGLSSTVCAQIIGTSGTRGIHGLKCKSETHDAAVAVLLDASNNSISDVTAPAEVPKITSSRVS
jgi:hypothetical protein